MAAMATLHAEQIEAGYFAEPEAEPTEEDLRWEQERERLDLLNRLHYYWHPELYLPTHTQEVSR